MAVLIVAIVALGIIVSGVTTLAHVALTTAGDSSAAIRDAAHSTGQLIRSEISRLTVCETALGSTIRFTLVNSGQESLHSFDEWDLTAFYNTASGAQVERLAYTTDATPSAGEWNVESIVNAAGNAELIGHGVVDPGERAQIVAEFASGVWASTKNRIKVATGNGATTEADISGTNACGFYLHESPGPPTGDSTSAIDLLADSSYPGQTTLYNYDTDRDSESGILIQKGGAGASESNATLYQNWQTSAFTTDYEIKGTVSLRLFAAMLNFSTVDGGEVIAYLRDYNGATYSEIASTSAIADPWDSGATGSFVEKTLDFDLVNYTIPAGNQLEIKLIVGQNSDNDMLFAYDTPTYPAYVEFPQVLDLYPHSTQRSISTTTYYELTNAPRDGGYFLHNIPTPPTGDTNAQAGLSLTTIYPSESVLYNYDADIDSVVGRTIATGGSGESEADIAQYQNWQTAAFDADLKVNGTVTVQFWAAMAGFNTTQAGEFTFYLRDYNGATYTEVASSTLTADPWDEQASGDWIKKLVEISVDDYTFVRGNQLELKVIVGSGAAANMLLAYDTSGYPAVLKLPNTTEIYPEGRPAILTADSGNQQGRFRPAENEGRLLYPLSGYTKISPSQWDVTYRVKTRDPYGFYYFDTAVEISPSNASQWEDIDLSAVVPEGTSGVLVELVNNNNGGDFSAMVRGKNDTRDYISHVGNQELGGREHRWQIVKVNGNREIQGYIGHASDIDLYAIGYTLGADPKFEDVPPDITPGTTGSWTNVDLSANVDPDADGVIVLLDNVTILPCVPIRLCDVQYGIREVGSGDSDTSNVLTGSGNALYFVGIDSNDQFQAYIASSDIDIYLIGQTKGSVVFNSTDTAVSDPSLNSWQQIDATSYGVPSSASGVILHVENDQGNTNEAGLRHGDSSDDWDKTLNDDAHLQGLAGLNSSSEWGQFQDHNSINVSVSAYTIGAADQVADIHADIDVLIRTDAGVIRATLASDVATTTDIGPVGWVTKTATFTPSEYTIVDQTDYLEINLFAHVTGNEANSSTLQFKIDDNSLPLADQTHIENIALKRE